MVTFHYAHRGRILAAFGGGTLAVVSLRALAAVACRGALIAVALGEAVTWRAKDWRAKEDWWVQEQGPIDYGMLIVGRLVQGATLASFSGVTMTSCRIFRRLRCCESNGH